MTLILAEGSNGEKITTFTSPIRWATHLFSASSSASVCKTIVTRNGKSRLVDANTNRGHYRKRNSFHLVLNFTLGKYSFVFYINKSSLRSMPN
jgi:hypothetical protein